MGTRVSEFYRPIFHKLIFLAIPCIYILELANYVYKNKNAFAINYQYHDHLTRYRDGFNSIGCTLHVTSLGVKSMGVKVFNHLPCQIKMKRTVRSFRSSLLQFHLHHNFYGVEEYFLFKT